MNKLREKFGNVILNQDHNDKCEQISDDFTIKFYDWALNEEGISHYTTAELLQIFKDRYYEIN